MMEKVEGWEKKGDTKTVMNWEDNFMLDLTHPFNYNTSL